MLTAIRLIGRHSHRCDFPLSLSLSHPQIGPWSLGLSNDSEELTQGRKRLESDNKSQEYEEDDGKEKISICVATGRPTHSPTHSCHMRFTEIVVATQDTICELWTSAHIQVGTVVPSSQQCLTIWLSHRNTGRDKNIQHKNIGF